MKITTVNKARKDYPNEMIKKGDTYYYCEPQRRKTGGVRKMRFKAKLSCESWISSYGKRFQGEFSSNIQSYNDRLVDLENEEQKQELLNEIDEFIDQKQSSLDNIPYQLQESHVLNEQIEEMNKTDFNTKHYLSTDGYYFKYRADNNDPNIIRATLYNDKDIKVNDVRVSEGYGSAEKTHHQVINYFEVGLMITDSQYL
jgi:hypothetical protein